MDDLIKRLRAVKWEPTYDAERMPDDQTLECVHVDMRPADFLALLREAAAALEAAREDAERYRWLRDSPERPCKVPCAYAVMPGDVEYPTPLGGETLDEAIDAAREARNG